MSDADSPPAPYNDGEAQQMAAVLRTAIASRSTTFDAMSGHVVSKGMQAVESRMTMLTASVAFLAIFGLAGAIYTSEREYCAGLTGADQCPPVDAGLHSTIRALVTVTTLVAVALHYMYFSLRYQYLRTAGQFFRKTAGIAIEDSFASSGMLSEFLFEAVLLLIHLPPGTDWYMTWSADSLRRNSLDRQVPPEVRYRATEFFTILMLVRVMFIFRIFFHMSHISNNAARSLGAISYVAVSPRYAFKAMLSIMPVFTLMTVFGICLLCFSYAIRVLERPVEPALNYYGSCVWLTVVTMTTLGYGDMAPNTTLGRMVMSVGVVAASVCLSLVVVELRKQLSAKSGPEMRVLSKLDEVDKKLEYKGTAAQVITRLYQMKKRRKKFKSPGQAELLLPPLRKFKGARLTHLAYEDETSEATVHNRNVVIMGEISQGLDSLDAQVDPVLDELCGTE